MEDNHPLRRLLKAFRQLPQRSTNRTTAETAQVALAPAPPPLPEDDLPPIDPQLTFPKEMFARLLLELPDHREKLAEAYDAEDMALLKSRVHHLLGGAAYCNAPELTNGLRELRLALKSEDPQTIWYYYMRAMDLIDTTLVYSGYRG